MFSRPQIILLQRAKLEAGLADDDYRDALETVTGQRTSKAPELTDRDLDRLLGYFEAIHWHAVDAGTLQPSGRADAVFRQRGYWAAKNTGQQTSRDRYTGRNQVGAIASLEASLAALGCGAGYCAAIRKNVCKGRTDARALHLYEAALERTLAAKRRRQEAAANQF
jgi:hypothetical protein